MTQPDTNTPFRSLRTPFPTLVALLIFGCADGGKAGVQTPTPVYAKIARRCATVLPRQEEMDMSKARLYVEIALVSETAPNRNWMTSLEELELPVTSVMQFVANPGIPTTMPWGDCLDAACDNRDARITLTAEFPQKTTEAIDLHVVLEKLPTTEDSAPVLAPERVSWVAGFDQHLQVRDQSPQVLEDPHHAFGGGTPILTSYLLTRPKDLFGLMACKAEQLGVDEIRPVNARP